MTNGARSRVGPDVASVLALVVGALATAGLLVLASLLSLCGLFGETCTDAETMRIGLATIGAGVTFLGVPGLVAVVRRDARWLLAPLVEAAVVAAVVVGVQVF